MDQEDRAEVRTLSGLNFILGVWLVISPYILNYNGSAAKWNQTIFGIVILVLAAARYLAPRFEMASWITGLSGLWMIIAPFILDYNGAVSYWNEVIVGIAVSLLAFWNTTIHAQPGRRVTA